MKTRSYIFACLFFSLTLSSTGQESKPQEEVQDVEKAINIGEAPGMMIFIEGASLRVIQNNWKRMVMPSTKFNRATPELKPVYLRKEGEFHALNTIINEIYPEPLNVYATIANINGGIRVTAFFEKDSTFITSATNEDIYLSSKNFLRNFYISNIKIVKADEIKKEEKKLSAMGKQLNRLQRQRNSYEKQIARSKVDIINQENKIRTIQTDQNVLSERISNLKLTIMDIEKQTEAYTEFSKRLKSEERNMKKLANSHKSSQTKITRQQQNIRKNEERIAANLKQQENLMNDTNTKTEQIRKLKELFSNIN